MNPVMPCYLFIGVKPRNLSPYLTGWPDSFVDLRSPGILRGGFRLPLSVGHGGKKHRQAELAITLRRAENGGRIVHWLFSMNMFRAVMPGGVGHIRFAGI